jgi:3',5'-cyclic AMP phosphodiesterase CpdA
MPTSPLGEEPLNRRTALGRLGLLLALGLWPGARPARGSGAAAKEVFRFAALNDLHHDAPECDAWFAPIFRQVQARQPAFVLLLGDLSNHGSIQSLDSIARLAAGLGIPVHTVPGNHDNDLEGDTRTYARAFPAGLNQVFEYQGWQWVGLDSTDSNRWFDTQVAEAHLRWLDARLPALDPAKPTVLFTHFPLAPGIGMPGGQVMTPKNAEAVLARFEHFNLRAALSGHFHGRTERPHGAARLYTGACCARVVFNHDGDTPKGWYLFTAYDDQSLRAEFVTLPPAAGPTPS